MDTFFDFECDAVRYVMEWVDPVSSFMWAMLCCMLLSFMLFSFYYATSYALVYGFSMGFRDGFRFLSLFLYGIRL